MKKKIFLMLAMVAVIACMLALAVSAESVHSGKVDLDATVTLDNGTVCNLFDSEGNALIWFMNGSELQSIRADDERVTYKCTYAFDVGNSTVGSVTAYEVSNMWIQLDESTQIPKGNIVVLNLMDDDVLINNNRDIGKPVNCLKELVWSNKIIEYAFLRLDTVAVQAQAFCGCTKLKYVNLEDLTELRQIGGGQAFGQSPALFEGETLDLTGTKLCAISGNGAFNGVPVAEIKLPNTVTVLNDWNIQGTAITKFVFPTGVTAIASSQFKNCASLKEIYINNTTTKIYDNAFLSTNALEKIFFVGTEAELKALLDNTAATGNSTFLAVAGENRENVISYAEYQALDDKSGKYAVYGYCDAYNEGKHTLSGIAKLPESIDFLKEIYFVDTCTTCNMAIADEGSKIEALFVCKGISAKDFGDDIALVQSYGINKAAISTYKNYVADFDFGILAYANNGGTACQPKPGEEKVVDIVFDNMANDYIEVKLTGVPQEHENVKLVFCAYVTEGESIYYLDDGETLSSVIGKSYKEIVG